jgi:hypothetical protein
MHPHSGVAVGWVEFRDPAINFLPPPRLAQLGVDGIAGNAKHQRRKSVSVVPSKLGKWPATCRNTSEKTSSASVRTNKRLTQ